MLPSDFGFVLTTVMIFIFERKKATHVVKSYAAIAVGAYSVFGFT